MIEVNYQNLIDFIKLNKLNQDKAIIKQWIDLLSINLYFNEVVNFSNDLLMRL